MRHDRKGIERWKAAVERAKEYLERYQEIPTGGFGAMIIMSKLDLYEKGDRSEALLHALESVE
jgi:hypothetical protein